ncbi:NAD(P)H-binding protein [Maribacter algicola]|uniref:NAD(P)H-binding protein n=1 Tax=Meishania litoralis TaxID=3434685 RepID=A0ACC7LHT2_9FLAO
MVIGVLGCGWLGWPLAKSFIFDEYQVHGSTTSVEKLQSLEKDGIKAFNVQLKEDENDNGITPFLKGVDILIINIPPKLRGNNEESYVNKMHRLHSAMKTSHVKKMIFVSSTSIYGDIEGEVTEKTKPRPSTESGRQLLATEKIFWTDPDLEVTIIRFGGLIGPNRHPVSILSGKTNLSGGNLPINLIHLNDCIAIIKSVVFNKWWGEIFNGVYPHHPKKKEYYSAEAIKKGLPKPHYTVEKDKKGKIIASFNLINVKKYRFMTPIVG